MTVCSAGNPGVLLSSSVTRSVESLPSPKRSRVQFLTREAAAARSVVLFEGASMRNSPIMEKVLAAVRTAPGKTEIREFPMPEIPADSALMKMEVAGICGTDVKLYKTPPSAAPVIMGHENIGGIANAWPEFTRRKRFEE